MKKCTGPCQRVREDQKFYTKKYKNGAVGLRSTCIDCGTKARDDWRKANKSHDDKRNNEYNKRNSERIRGLKLVKNYWPNLTWEQAIEAWNKMYNAQGQHCALCENNKRLHVDHDHKTGKVRGLLCYNCNNGLGRFQDNTCILEKAIIYLNKSRQET